MKKVGLTTLTFENYEESLKLKPMDSQKEFVEDWATILAIAYIGENLNLNGMLYIITYNDIPVGRGLIGKEALGLLLDKIKEYPDGNRLPITLSQNM